MRQAVAGTGHSNSQAVLSIRMAYGMVAIAAGSQGSHPLSRDGVPGDVFLVRGKGAEDALAVLERYVPGGARLLSITRTFPDKLSFPLSLGCSDIYWLTGLVGEKRISPSSLGRIVSIVKNFIENSPGTAIFLEGIEYLVLENDFNSVLRMLSQLSDLAVHHSATMVVFVDSVALTQRESALIERTCSASAVEVQQDQL